MTVIISRSTVKKLIAERAVALMTEGEGSFDLHGALRQAVRDVTGQERWFTSDPEYVGVSTRVRNLLVKQQEQAQLDWWQREHGGAR